MSELVSLLISVVALLGASVTAYFGYKAQAKSSNANQVVQDKSIVAEMYDELTKNQQARITQLEENERRTTARLIEISTELQKAQQELDNTKSVCVECRTHLARSLSILRTMLDDEEFEEYGFPPLHDGDITW